MPAVNPRKKSLSVVLGVLLGGALAAGGYLTLDQHAQADAQALHDQRVTDDLSAFRAAQQTTATTPPVTTTTTPPPSSSTAPPSSSEPPPESSSAPSSSAEKTTKAKPADSSKGAQVVALVNQERAKAGCGDVGVDNRLVQAAQAHSDDMSARNYFSHTTPEGVTFDQRIKKAGYPKPGAENIAKGSTTAEQTMKMWMNSDGHRRNILNCELTMIGVGVTTDGWYWTQNFGY
ncbi:CAP domain-containing protein [Amycolatopsis albispora]|uniref:CAP domain-containing protein n=1 Tax=Amycolatopsis albispora TaxID=1804986 RepID=UPI001F3BDE45|nr:CAP domain-containing protein [Amycolatopsis albispora]